MAFRGSIKLAPRFFSPYQIIGKVGTVAYRLALPHISQIHNMFYVSFLRKLLGLIILTSKRFLPITDDSTFLPQPEAVLDYHVICKGKYRPKYKIMVK